MSLRFECVKRNFELERIKHQLKGKKVNVRDNPLAGSSGFNGDESDDDAKKTPGTQRAGKGKGNRGNKSSKNSSKSDGDKATEAHHISSLAAEQGSFESAKHLLKKKMVLKQASQDALYMKVREVVINRHLAEIHRQGHDWPTADACGVPLDTSAGHEAIEAKVLGSVRKEYGDDSLQKLIAQVEEEWKRMCSVRQKYSNDAKQAARTGAGAATTG